MKRFAAALLAAVLLMSGVAGCGSPDTAKTSSTGSSEISSSSSENGGTSSALTADNTSSGGTGSQTSSGDGTGGQNTSQASSGTQTTTGNNRQTTTPTNTNNNTNTNTNTNTNKTPNVYHPVSPSLSGTITLSGSTSVYPLAAALTEAFKKQYKNVKINITNVTGSGAGLADAKNGIVSFGMRSSEWDNSSDIITPYQIAMDGVAIVVHNSNSVSNITGEQLNRIYNKDKTVNGLSKLASWSELGGPSAAILPVSREAGSGTRTCFEDVIKALKIDGKAYALASGYATGEIAQSTEAVQTQVSNNSGAIGYMSLGSVTSAVKKLKFEGVEATEANILNGSYKFSRPFLLLRNNTKAMSAAEKEFLKFALSDQGQQIVNTSHFISLSAQQIANETAKIN